MKKYILKFKDSKKVFSEYKSREEASAKLMEFVNDINKCLGIACLSPFDFVLEEIKCKEVNEVITDFEIARKVLGIKPNDDYLLISGEYPGKEYYDVERLVSEITPKYLKALIALNRLFTIAEAWNKADGFVPDFSDTEQEKWYPWFKYNKDASKFVYASTYSVSTVVDATFGSRLCFKTKERAAQFGK